MTVRFRETDGKPIEREGLLIAHRSYRLPILWGVRGASWNRVVPIESGAAKLPCKWTLASIYIWWFYVPQIAIFPGDNLSLLPLVPGYYVAPGHSFAQPTTYLVHQTEIEEGYVALARSSDDLVIAIEYWKTVALEHLQPPGVAFDGYEPELRLPDGQYQMVKRFVEAEVDRLRALKRSVPPAGREPPGPKGREVVPTM